MGIHPGECSLCNNRNLSLVTHHDEFSLADGLGPSAFFREAVEKREKHRLQAARIAHDPSALFYFGFSSEHRDHIRQAVNRSIRGSERVPFAEVAGAEFIEGRLFETKALWFNAPSGSVTFDMPGAYQKMTFATRLRLDGFDHVYNAIMTTHSFEPGQIHWHVLYNGVVEIGINADKDQPGLQFQTEPVLFPKLGQWIHLAATVDARKQEVVIYLDGVEILRKTDTRIPSEFCMKNGILGNWTFPEKWVVVHKKRNLNGALEDFIVFSRILTPVEIAALCNEEYGEEYNEERSSQEPQVPE